MSINLRWLRPLHKHTLVCGPSGQAVSGFIDEKGFSWQGDPPMRLQYQQEAGGKWHDVPIVDEILTPPLEPIPDYGDLMTKEEWLSGCEAGAFIDYDGFGNLATADGVYAERIFPSQAKNYNFPKWVTHIVWYNR